MSLSRRGQDLAVSTLPAGFNQNLVPGHHWLPHAVMAAGFRMTSHMVVVSRDGCGGSLPEQRLIHPR